MAFETEGNYIGETISLDMRYFRAVPSGSTVTISANVLHQFDENLLIKTDVFLKNTICYSGTLTRRLNCNIKRTIFDFPPVKQIKSENIQIEHSDDVNPVELSSICSKNFPYIVDSELSDYMKSNLQQAIYWVDRNQTLESRLHPTEFSSTIMKTAKIIKVCESF